MDVRGGRSKEGQGGMDGWSNSGGKGEAGEKRMTKEERVK